ncbi:uncharacterized protein LOC116803819 [Drosophila mojavensis]|uniref:uncharacterized protein LOC116803819 n=1 Tax=Drosophila mojavensis TaxID=7230 RepID=UPI0013EE90F8|nr:uncharacterized protein LOC116803819 [Drosophila mojavensis]
MRWLTFCCLILWIVSLFDFIDNSRYKPNFACLVKNKYKHERYCRGPRRKFYAFHRIIMNCIPVFTKCSVYNKYNEWKTLKSCNRECAYHMIIRNRNKNPNNNGTASNSTTPGEGVSNGAG